MVLLNAIISAPEVNGVYYKSRKTCFYEMMKLCTIINSIPIKPGLCNGIRSEKFKCNKSKCSTVILTRKRGHHYGKHQNDRMGLILKQLGFAVECNCIIRDKVTEFMLPFSASFVMMDTKNKNGLSMTPSYTNHIVGDKASKGA